MNKTTEAFETWWADTGEQSLYALNTTTDDDIKTIAGIAWEAAIREALADHSGDANEMVGCAYCDNPLFAGTKCNNCGKAALSEPEMNLNCPSVQARLATVWGYVKAEHVKQEPLSEALQIASVALQDIACSSQTENLLWWQIRAREAQKQVSERFTSHAPVQPVKQEPVAFRTMELRVEPMKQEPVAWDTGDELIPNNSPLMSDWIRENCKPLYAAPVDAKAIRAEALEEAAKHLAESGLIGSNDCAAAIRGLK